MRLALLLFPVALLFACASTETTGRSYEEPPSSILDNPAELEKWAYGMTGDVRVFYFIKPGTSGQGSSDGRVRPGEQKEMGYTFVNKSHSLYAGLPDDSLKVEEYYLNNTDMLDLLRILRDQVGFFDRGVARDIGAQDPVARARADSRTERIIAVEQLKDGLVTCAYLARPYVGPDEVLPESAREPFRRFNRAQEFIIQFTRFALPKADTKGRTGILKDRR